MSGIKTGNDYLFHAKKLLNSSKIKANFPVENYKASIGSHSFDVMQIELTVGGMVIHQKYYVSIIKGYALAFIASYVTEDEEFFLQTMVDSITLK